MNRYLFISGVESVPNDADFQDFTQCFNIAGGNTGNFVYGKFGKSYLCYDKEKSVTILHASELKNIEHIDDKFDKVVMFCANQINPNDDYILQFYDFFEKTSLPIVLLGLGCQSDKNYSFKFLEEIPEYIKLLKMLSNKGNVFIGVRGKFTKKCFDKIGVKCTVIGCPSYYKKRLGYIKHYNHHGALKIDTSSDWFDASNIWYKILCRNKDAQIILQSAPEQSLYRLSKGTATPEDFNVIRNIFKTDDIISNKDNQFLNRCQLFFNVETWADYVKNRDFYIGPKIHGCLIHLVNGIPGFLIVHDSRTREFAELFSIPHMSSAKLDENLDFYKIYKNYPILKMQLKFIKLYWRYLCFLKKSGLDTELSKVDIIKYLYAIAYTFIKNTFYNIKGVLKNGKDN